MGPRSVITVLGLMAALSACHSLPKDPEGTSARLRSGAPVRAAQVAGVAAPEPARAIVERAARDLGTGVDWQTGEGEPLLHALEQGKLDVVVGSFAKKSPWMPKVALSDSIGGAEPADTSEPALRLARANGENEWIVRLDRAIGQ